MMAGKARRRTTATTSAIHGDKLAVYRKTWMMSAIVAASIAFPATILWAPAARAATTQEELLRLLKEQSAELKKLKEEVNNLKKQRSAP